MASLISTEEKAILTGTFQDVFDTFKREIVVYKEPQKVIGSIDEGMIFGYGEYSNPVNYTYESVSSTFYATVRYIDNQQIEHIEVIGTDVPKGLVRMKVEKEAMDFIEDGKNEKITFDKKSFNIISTVAVKRFLDSEFFVYYLEVTK
ncbi:hypothetical protein CL634_03385 [bacterium]|nr:hypothetical protein [bacterium]|tara:strand:- start:324 stop:764 length:441 start_codon:yes stop_codon:yes gene_type:complete